MSDKKPQRAPKAPTRFIPLTPQQQLDQHLKRWQAKPEDYCTEVLGVKDIWRLQKELLACLHRAIAERKPIYMASGHSLGKDYISAAIGLWFLQTFIPSQVLLTGPTERQVEKIMWKETMTHWNSRKINLGGRPLTEPYLEIDKDWYLIGFTTKETGATKEGGGGKFQGFHAPNVCVIVTEAQSVEDEIYDQIDAISTPEKVLTIFIGNPTRAKGRFAKGLKDKTRNIVFNFSCLENPNYVERRTVIPGLASYEWVETMREKWGEDDPRWVGRVLGQVPDMAMNNIFPDSLLELASQKHGFLATHSDNRGVSVDPAGEGVDDNVFYAGSGGEVMAKFTRVVMSATDKAHKAVEMCKAIGGGFIIVDCDGIGIETVLQLEKLSPTFLGGIKIIRFFGSAPSRITVDGKPIEKGGRRIYENMRCEAAFVTADRIKAGKVGIEMRDVELVEDLREDLFMENKRSGLLQILPKEEIKEVLGRSPGCGDAYKMLQWAFAQEYERLPYKDDSGLPAYATTDGMSMEHHDMRNLPTHAIMS